jgi:hypothetical protein
MGEQGGRRQHYVCHSRAAFPVPCLWHWQLPQPFTFLGKWNVQVKSSHRRSPMPGPARGGSNCCYYHTCWGSATWKRQIDCSYQLTNDASGGCRYRRFRSCSPLLNPSSTRSQYRTGVPCPTCSLSKNCMAGCTIF